MNQCHHTEVWQKQGPQQAGRRADRQLTNGPSCSPNSNIYPWPLDIRTNKTFSPGAPVRTDFYICPANKDGNTAVVCYSDEVYECLSLPASIVCLFVCVCVCVRREVESNCIYCSAPHEYIFCYLNFLYLGYFLPVLSPILFKMA